MTKLDCSAKNCTYNKEHNCCVSSIKVGGSSAVNEAETKCTNFVEQKGNMTNSADRTANTHLEVHCLANNCAYNKAEKCHAEDISISGHSACHSDETRCSTFKVK